MFRLGLAGFALAQRDSVSRVLRCSNGYGATPHPRPHKLNLSGSTGIGQEGEGAGSAGPAAAAFARGAA
jgi:hypothetical protein